jgi:hypothetical protein
MSIRTIRIYKINSEFNNLNNGVYDISNYNLDKYELSKKYIVTKKMYLSISQEIINDKITTYCEQYKILYHIDNKIVMEYKQDILDNLEFPPLNKYDFEETYEQNEYITKYGKIISNKYQTYIELNKEYNNYDEILDSI